MHNCSILCHLEDYTTWFGHQLDKPCKYTNLANIVHGVVDNQSCQISQFSKNIFGVFTQFIDPQSSISNSKSIIGHFIPNW